MHERRGQLKCFSGCYWRKNHVHRISPAEEGNGRCSFMHCLRQLRGPSRRLFERARRRAVRLPGGARTTVRVDVGQGAFQEAGGQCSQAVYRGDESTRLACIYVASESLNRRE